MPSGNRDSISNLLSRGDVAGGHRSREAARKYLSEFKTKLGIEKAQDRLLDSALEEFLSDVVLGAAWYQKRYLGASKKVWAYIALNCLLIIGLPLAIIGIGSLAKSDQVSALTSQIVGILTGILALQKTLASWYASQQRYAIWYKSASDLKTLYYSLLQSWSGGAATKDKQAFLTALGNGTGAARKIIADEQLDFYQRLSLPSFDYLDMLTSTRSGVSSFVTGLLPGISPSQISVVGKNILTTTPAIASPESGGGAQAADQIGPVEEAQSEPTQQQEFVEQPNTLGLNGALKWLLPTLESAYTPLVSKTGPLPASHVMQMSSLRPKGRGLLSPVARDFWKQAVLNYKQKKAASFDQDARIGGAASVVLGQRNWQSLGPSVVMNGQTIGNQPVGGRVVGLAVAAGGKVVFGASANGGVFRSDDGGATWHSLMDSFDLQPTNFASASLICGAIAADGTDAQRIYVGTGEGETFQLFKLRISNALPAYKGVGPIRSDDGGSSWIPEPSVPDLAGDAFFALAIDPTNRENVVGATTNGLYQRQPVAGGQFQWTQVRQGTHSSAVAVQSGNSVRFFAAEWGQGATQSGVFVSLDNGDTWSPLGNGFPVVDTGRITLGVQSGNPKVVYALIANESNGGLNGLYRFDEDDASWKPVGGLPDVLPLYQGSSQGAYDLAIAVDPADADLVYLGGSYANIDPYPASIWRCQIAQSDDGFVVANANSIGTHAHSDVHVLTHSPGDSDELWCGCDGGIFLNRDPKGSGEFTAQNNGLACLCSNFIGQHPTDPKVVFTGLQDNGTAVTDSSGAVWTHVMGGDGGYCLVNWADPRLVLVYSNGTVLRSSSGGLTDSGWSKVTDFPWSTMTQPLVSTPYSPKSPVAANLVALGAGTNIHMSSDFGATWAAALTISSQADGNGVFALTFASSSRLFAGTTLGEVYQADLVDGSWKLTRLDNASQGPLGVTGLINDIAIDWNDRTLRSIFVAFAGVGDNRRVWRYDGVKWQDRSGSSPATHLLNVEHNAIVVDPMAPLNVYAGADIGVWHSPDSGLNWSLFENGLPEAPVFDLQVHATQRLLRAALHGRGVYEIQLS